MTIQDKIMEKLCIVSGSLFLTATAFALASLILPNWLVSDVGGKTSIGLLTTCMTVYGRSEMCYTPRPLRGEWIVAFLCIVFGILCLSATIVSLVVSHYKQKAYIFAKWLGFVSMIVFCLAAVLFPVGFDMDQIGGTKYQLPNNFQVGISYIFFILALWLTVVSELFASKICLPRF